MILLDRISLLISSTKRLIINLLLIDLTRMLCAGTVGSFLGKSSMSNSRVDQHLHEESNVNGDHMDDLSGAEDDDGSGALG